MTETLAIAVSRQLTLRGQYRDVKELEEAICGLVGRMARELYVEAYRRYQEAWLREEWGRYFEVVDVLPATVKYAQTAMVLRKPHS